MTACGLAIYALRGRLALSPVDCCGAPLSIRAARIGVVTLGIVVGGIAASPLFVAAAGALLVAACRVYLRLVYAVSGVDADR